MNSESFRSFRYFVNSAQKALLEDIHSYRFSFVFSFDRLCRGGTLFSVFNIRRGNIKYFPSSGASLTSPANTPSILNPLQSLAARKISFKLAACTPAPTGYLSGSTESSTHTAVREVEELKHGDSARHDQGEVYSQSCCGREGTAEREVRRGHEDESAAGERGRGPTQQTTTINAAAGDAVPGAEPRRVGTALCGSRAPDVAAVRVAESGRDNLLGAGAAGSQRGWQ
ncbi:hypothetical protein B0H19DRAFT_1061612 [Mycena capillaripes]|nr:hypothetical protein B0H19DRAFT_1061612 [Mycena capillaripes]